MVLMEQLAELLGRYPVLVAVLVLKQEPTLSPVRCCAAFLAELVFARFAHAVLALLLAERAVAVKVDNVHLGQMAVP